MRYPTKWITFGDANPLDYGGGFWRQTGPRTFQFIELTNMDEACGRDNEGQSRYVVELALVDLSAIPEEEQASARQSCGWDNAPHSDSALAEMCYQYGTRAPLGSWDGNNAGKLLRAAKSEARSLLDSRTLASQLEKPVNKIGSTAAEFMRGDIQSAMMRGIEAGDQGARIMGKMHGATNEEMDAIQRAAQLKFLPVVIMRHSDIRACPFAILLPSHYRLDGTCLCDNAEHRKMMIAEWGYSPKDFEAIPLRGD